MAGRIFLSYRRGDEPAFAGRLFDRLEEAFGRDNVFMDVDSIPPGRDFVHTLEDHVSRCDVLLAVIGPQWLVAVDEAARPRLADPADFVRIEIGAALNLGKRVVPVLVGDAQLPRIEDLPDPLKPLVRRNAVRLTHERFKSDVQGLVKALATALDEETAAIRKAHDGLPADAVVATFDPVGPPPLPTPPPSADSAPPIVQAGSDTGRAVAPGEMRLDDPMIRMGLIGLVSGLSAAAPWLRSPVTLFGTDLGHLMPSFLALPLAMWLAGERRTRVLIGIPLAWFVASSFAHPIYRTLKSDFYQYERSPDDAAIAFAVVNLLVIAVAAVLVPGFRRLRVFPTAITAGAIAGLVFEYWRVYEPDAWSWQMGLISAASAAPLFALIGYGLSRPNSQP